MLLLRTTTEGGEDGQERTKQGVVGRAASMVFGLALAMALVLPTPVTYTRVRIVRAAEDGLGKSRGCPPVRR